jgi:hypothetical protein
MFNKPIHISHVLMIPLVSKRLQLKSLTEFLVRLLLGAGGGEFKDH